MFPNWDHHAFVTNRTGPTGIEDLHHRAHAVVELAIRDLKDNGLAHCPSGLFNANGAWLALAVLAHNLTRWTITIGTGKPVLITGATTRRTLIATPGPMAHSARRYTLHLPTRWPWATTFTKILEQPSHHQHHHLNATTGPPTSAPLADENKPTKHRA